ncbi:hypothetical protein [Oceaniovalibus sp. ACAM 378]|uniref:hypothetical protein n=1 Tax=Oceaniovalibus sp. ACAM 378 TaxID=2599923 RepID=UPI0011D56FA3|nr:hypothetical protein [Oceaniovalibus sp. ACAM 378]TYB90714.1 hypothetical protein FQ320_03405 [Oceaniovalibus sp. ACAM 378]
MTPERSPGGLVYLLGPLRVQTADGRDCTPAGVLRKALFAVLALSERGSRSRVTLQDMFWGAHPGARAAGSLRTALSTLKSELAPLGDDILRIDPQSVSLNCAALWIDTVAYRNQEVPLPGSGRMPDLLEGIDLGGADREVFEDWLRVERSAWDDFVDQAETVPVRPKLPAEVTKHHVITPDQEPRVQVKLPEARIGLGLLMVVGDGITPNLEQQCDDVLDAIGASARELCGADIYDYRDGIRHGFTDPAGRGAAHLLQLHVRTQGESVRLTLKVIETATRRSLWDQRVVCDSAEMVEVHEPKVAEFISRAIEQLAVSILPNADLSRSALHAPYQSLNMMFTLSPDALERAGLLLQSAWDETGDPVHLGLLCYLETFHVGESWGHAVARSADVTALTREGLNAGAFNGLFLTTAGYALFYLTDENELAGDLLTRAVEVAPAQALAWDHLALFQNARGNHAAARLAAGRAMALGRFSPLRYAYDTTLSMVAHAEGDLDAAVQYGRRALARKPEFSAALRYVTAGLGLMGRRAEAEQMAQRILRLDPDFTTLRSTQGLLKLANAGVPEELRKGLIMAGLP